MEGVSVKRVSETEQQNQTEKPNRTKWLRRAGLIVGLLGAGIATVTYWSFTQEVLGPFSIVIPILVLGAILFLAWKKPLIGGILLVVASMPLALFGLPLIAGGIIFILLWAEERGHPELNVDNGLGED